MLAVSYTCICTFLGGYFVHIDSLVSPAAALHESTSYSPKPKLQQMDEISHSPRIAHKQGNPPVVRVIRLSAQLSAGPAPSPCEGRLMMPCAWAQADWLQGIFGVTFFRDGPHGHAACAGIHALHGARCKGLTAVLCNCSGAGCKGSRTSPTSATPHPVCCACSTPTATTAAGWTCPACPPCRPARLASPTPSNSTAMPPVPAHVDPCQQVGSAALSCALATDATPSLLQQRPFSRTAL